MRHKLNQMEEDLLEVSQILENNTFYARTDLDYLYVEQDAEGIDIILESLGFKVLSRIFRDEKVDYEVFYNLNQYDIYCILKDYPVGIRKKFELAFMDWKKKQNVDCIPSTSSFIANQPSSRSLNSYSSARNLVGDITVRSILDNSEAGILFMQNMKDRQELIMPEKRKLADIIVHYFLNGGISIGKSDISKLADEIPVIFKEEISTSYFAEIKDPKSKNKKVCGLLYSKYYNAKNSTKNAEVTKESSKRKNEERVEDLESQSTKFSSLEISCNDFIKANPYNEMSNLLPIWNSCLNLRHHHFKSKQSMTEIFDEYKILQRPEAYLLMEIDFQTLFSDVSFADQWIKIQPQLIEVLPKNLSNAYVKSLFEDIAKESFHSQVIITLLGINSFLYESGKHKLSMMDTSKFIFFLTNGPQSFEIDLKEWKEKLKSLKLTFQPFIVGFGKDIKNVSNEFLIVFEDYQYKFKNILKALEILMNIYYIFNLEYPYPNKNVFKYIMEQIYQIPSDSSPSVKTLIKFVK